MRVSGWACDVCEKFSEEIPPEWFKVNRAVNGDEAAQLVCSARCLVKMGEDIITLESPKKTRRSLKPNTEPCPECGKDDIATASGLVTHRSRMHGVKKGVDNLA